MANKSLTPAEKAEREAAKAANFVKVAEARMTKALDAIAKLRNLGASNYVSTQPQRDAIVQALEAAVIRVGQSLSGKVEATGGFTLPKA